MEQGARSHEQLRGRQWGRLVALAGVVLIGVGTLSGSSDTVPPPWCLRCALSSQGLVADVIVNVLLFVPLGVGMRLAGLRVRAAVITALAISLAVELTQAYVLPGRVANFLDLAANTLGAGIAAAATPRWRIAILPDATQARPLAAAALGALIAIVALSAWALTPAAARTSAVVDGVDEGGPAGPPERVLSAAIDGQAVRTHDTLQAYRVDARPIAVELALQASRSRWRTEPGVRIVADGLIFLELGIDGNELELEMRRKGETARLRSPSVRVRRLTRGPIGKASAALDTLRLRAAAGRWQMALAVTAHDASADLVMRLHALAGWALFLPAPRSARLADLLSALWAGVVVAPVGYWGAAAARRRSGLAIVALLALTVGAVLATGSVVGAPRPPASAILAVVVAVFGAWGVQRTVRARRQALRRSD